MTYYTYLYPQSVIQMAFLEVDLWNLLRRNIGVAVGLWNVTNAIRYIVHSWSVWMTSDRMKLSYESKQMQNNNAVTTPDITHVISRTTLSRTTSYTLFGRRGYEGTLRCPRTLTKHVAGVWILIPILFYYWEYDHC